MIIDERLVTGREGGVGDIGRITRERFGLQIRQLEELGILKPGAVTVDAAMTDAYLPAGG
jgi:hypothetical protein